MHAAVDRWGCCHSFMISDHWVLPLLWYSITRSRSWLVSSDVQLDFLCGQPAPSLWVSLGKSLERGLSTLSNMGASLRAAEGFWSLISAVLYPVIQVPLELVLGRSGPIGLKPEVVGRLTPSDLLLFLREPTIVLKSLVRVSALLSQDHGFRLGPHLKLSGTFLFLPVF